MADALTHEWFIDGTVTEVDRLAWIADGADPAAPVPTCPGWTMAKLVKHLGTVQRWATEIVATRSSDFVDSRSLDLGLPEKESDYAGWLTDGVPPLVSALRAAGPSAAVWAWGQEQSSGWWARRMRHESTMHRADAELANRRTPVIDPVAAADAIDEFLANLPAARRAKAGLADLPAGQSLHLHATDAEGEWLIRFTGSGIETERGHAKATAAVRGRLTLLLLFAYGRIAPDDDALTVFGDEGVLAAWQEKATM